MLIVGLLSTPEEVQELQFIAKVCSVRDRIQFIVHIEQCKEKNKVFQNKGKF